MPCPLADIDGFFAQRRRAEAVIARLIAGDPATGIRAVNAYFLGPVPNLALAAGGPHADDADRRGVATVDQSVVHLRAEHPDVRDQR